MVTVTKLYDPCILPRERDSMSQPTINRGALEQFDGHLFDDVSIDGPWELREAFSTLTRRPGTDEGAGFDASRLARERNTVLGELARANRTVARTTGGEA
ncbi:hypothetical protein JCM30237_23410 [Halolamina litorea]